MKFISEEIKEDYQQWNPGDTIFIDSPTGSGKTTFILQTLLPFVCSKEQRILYLVNRKMLKEQLETEIGQLPFELRNCICIQTYHMIENAISGLYYNSTNGVFQPNDICGVRQYAGYDYVVCDECHYFLSDSNFNTNTWLSFRWIQDCFGQKRRIFISATIESIKEYIVKDDQKKVYGDYTKVYGFRMKGASVQIQKFKGTRKEYTGTVDYSYIEPHILYQSSELLELFVKTNDKWLIFVDNISFGTSLRDKILETWKSTGKKDQEEKVILLTSRYQENPDSANEVEIIKKENRQNAKVLIATSVMDNGINLQDLSLRNVVLMADNKTEFVQMLGRKRADGLPVKVYLYKLDKEHFTNRLRRMKAINQIASEYWKVAIQYVQRNLEGLLKQGAVPAHVGNAMEQNFILNQHKLLMQGIAKKQINIDILIGAFYVYDGLLHLNPLAFQRTEIAKQYYCEVIREFDSMGEDAFLYRQLEWLGKNKEECEAIIAASKISEEERCRETIIQKLDDAKNVALSKEDAISLKNSIQSELCSVAEYADVNDDERKIRINAFKKRDRPMSAQDMDFLREHCNIPYRLEIQRADKKTGEKTAYTVQGTDDM